MNGRLLLSLTLALATSPLLAQPPAPPPPAAPRPAPPPAAPGPAGIAPARVLTPAEEIPLDQAIDAARTALETCRTLNAPSVVGVADLNGHFRALLRADGAGPPYYDYMRRKVYTVLKKGMPSGEFGALPAVAALPRGAVIEGDPNLIPWAGAVPIKRAGTTIGVISVSGPTGGADDLKCAMAGMAKLRL